MLNLLQKRRDGSTVAGRKYYGVFLSPTADGWETLCFGLKLRASTLDGIKRAVRDNYPACLAHNLRRRG